MATVTFTAHLREVAPQGSMEAAGATVGAVLESMWALHPQLRNYLMDDQDQLRRHIAIFLDGRLLRSPLAVRVGRHSRIYVMQALSGG